MLHAHQVKNVMVSFYQKEDKRQQLRYKVMFEYDIYGRHVVVT